MDPRRGELSLGLAARTPPLTYRAFIPEEPTGQPALVLVHGRSRAAAPLFQAFLPAAMTWNVPLLAPTFSRTRFPRYQQLAGVAGPLAARQALLAVLDDVRRELGPAAHRVNLLGFSGGAQFAHRFALLTPHRVHRIAVVAAGWYTYLDPELPFPLGVAPSERSGGLSPNVDAFLRLPIHIMVGAEDTERDTGLRSTRIIDRIQGKHRLIRAVRWLNHLEESARIRGIRPRVTLDVLPKTSHSLRKAVVAGNLVTRAFDFFHLTRPIPEPPRTCDLEPLP